MIYDVVVVGAGPAGSIAARGLSQAGRRVALLAPPAPPGPRVGESLRGAARRVLAQAGLLPVLETHRPHPGNRAAWGRETLVDLDGIRDPYGLGVHLDRARFDADLRAAAGVEDVPHALVGCTRDEGVWRIASDGPALTARFVIDASGRRSAVARALGVERRRDAPLVAVVTWVRPPASDRDERTLIEAIEDGWFYTARLPDHSRVLCFHALPDVARRLRREPAAWAERVAATRHVSPRVAEAEPLTKRMGREAGGAVLSRFGGPGWLAVGDAALAFDPLSSQGLLHALVSGWSGARAVDAALREDPEPGLAYGRMLAEVRRRYVDHHHRFYAAEQRWPQAAFWASRMASSSSTPRQPSASG